MELQKPKGIELPIEASEYVPRIWGKKCIAMKEMVAVRAIGDESFPVRSHQMATHKSDFRKSLFYTFSPSLTMASNKYWPCALHCNSANELQKHSPQNSVAAKSSKETKPINRSELRRNRAFWWQDSCPVVVLKYATVSTAKTFRVGQRRRQTKTANRQTSRLRNKSQININRANAEG